MKLILYLSDCAVPLVIFYIVGFGVLMKRPVYDDFTEGAKEGIRAAVSVMPTLVGLMVGVGILRSSGLLEFLVGLLDHFAGRLGVPSQLLPVAIVKLFSSSAATGLALDIFRESGPDSRLGLAVSIMLSCTETVFYTMSVYFLSVKIKKTRYTLPGALLATGIGVIVSVLLANCM